MIPISENIEYYCDFSLPGEEQRFSGKFSFVRREVVGEFFSLPEAIYKIQVEEFLNVDVERDIPIVHCEFKNEQNKTVKASLIYFQITTYSIGSIIRGTFYARFIAFGKFIDDIDLITSDLLYVQPKYIDQWAPFSSFKTSFQKGISINEQKVPPVALYKSENKNISLVITSNYKGNPEAINLSKLAQFKIARSECISFNCILDEVESIRRLVSLCYFDTVPIELFITYLGENELIWIQSDNRNYISRRVDYRYFIPLHLKQVENFQTIFERWFEMNDNLLLITTKYFETSSNLFVTHVAFQEYVNILERMAGLPEPKSFWTNDVNLQLEKIKKLKNQYHFFKKHLQKKEKPTRLEDKLLITMGSRPFVKELITNNVSLFCKGVATTRNWYTHPTASKPEDIIHKNKIHSYTINLKLIVHTLILIELGVDENFLIGRLKAVKEVRSIIDYISYE